MSNEYVSMEDYRRVLTENARLRREGDLLRGRVHTLEVERMRGALNDEDTDDGGPTGR